MQVDPLGRFLFNRPFEPFVLTLVTRREVLITHPESLSIYLGGLGLWLVLPSGQIEFIEGDAVVSVRSARAADPTGFIEYD